MLDGHLNQPLQTQISFAKVPNIGTFLESILKADERTVKIRLAEIAETEMTVPEWNVFGIAARVVLRNHQSYSDVIRAIQDKGGIGRGRPETTIENQGWPSVLKTAGRSDAPSRR